MKVRIIKNNPEFVGTEASIEQFVGREFYGGQQQGTKNVNIDFGYPRGTMTVYEGEYEVIDIVEELKYMIKTSNVNIFNIEMEEIIKFVMDNREELVGLLR